MYQTVKVEVRGARPSKGEFDGVKYDKTLVYIEQPLDPSVGIGSATQEYSWGASGNFEQLRHLKTPILAEADFATTTNGRGAAKIVLTGLRPLVK